MTDSPREPRKVDVRSRGCPFSPPIDRRDSEDTGADPLPLMFSTRSLTLVREGGFAAKILGTGWR